MWDYPFNICLITLYSNIVQCRIFHISYPSHKSLFKNIFSLFVSLKASYIFHM